MNTLRIRKRLEKHYEDILLQFLTTHAGDFSTPNKFLNFITHFIYERARESNIVVQITNRCNKVWTIHNEVIVNYEASSLTT